MSPLDLSLSDRIVCHCLRVTRGEIEAAIAVTRCETVRDVMDQTGAGTGCTACHCAIRELLAIRKPLAARELQAAQCPDSSSSPTCVIR